MRKKSDPTFIAEFRKTENIQDVPIPKFYSNFQFNNSVLCKESFSIPKVLIIGDVSKSRVFEYTIGNYINMFFFYIFIFLFSFFFKKGRKLFIYFIIVIIKN